MSLKKYFVPDATFFEILRRGEEFATPKGWLTSLFHNSPLHWWRLSRGTKSVLFGVHQFLWHPLTVGYAWRKLYGRWPSLYQWIAVFCHDIGYLGKEAMDSPDGQTHPEFGAKVAQRLAYLAARLRGNHPVKAVWIAANVHDLSLCHSTHYAQQKNRTVSQLYLPDKACVLTDPMWFYLLRAWLSGEIHEYVGRQNHDRWMRGESKFSNREWLRWYRSRIQQKVDAFNSCECDICTDEKVSKV